jgi:hypothetical protein
MKVPFGPSTPRLSARSSNTSHDVEHDRGIVTSMRLSKMAPPSSQGQGMRQGGRSASGAGGSI